MTSLFISLPCFSLPLLFFCSAPLITSRAGSDTRLYSCHRSVAPAPPVSLEASLTSIWTRRSGSLPLLCCRWQHLAKNDALPLPAAACRSCLRRTLTTEWRTCRSPIMRWWAWTGLSIRDQHGKDPQHNAVKRIHVIWILLVCRKTLSESGKLLILTTSLKNDLHRLPENTKTDPNQANNFFGIKIGFLKEQTNKQKQKTGSLI